MAALIRPIHNEEDFAAFGGLIRDYVSWCKERYADDPKLVAGVFSAQTLDDEIAELRRRYSPPEGAAFLAEDEHGPCGAVAYRRLTPAICEMKRLYVAPRQQGKGLGRRLSETVLNACRAQGCRTIRLDTMDRMTQAIAMYERLGFRRCAPYRTYPQAIAQRIVFMELPLQE